MFGPSIYVLIPKNEVARAWIDNNLDPEAQTFGMGIVIEHRYIQDICIAICEEGLQKYFDLIN